MRYKERATQVALFELTKRVVRNKMKVRIIKINIFLKMRVMTYSAVVKLRIITLR